MGPKRRQGWGPMGAGAALLLILALLGVLLPTPGDRSRGAALQPAPSSFRATAYSITLPDAAPHLPDGPNRELFRAQCQLCHSARLVLTQPRLSEKKWREVVHKMVVVYRAPLLPEQDLAPDRVGDLEQAIVAYLVAVRGEKP